MEQGLSYCCKLRENWVTREVDEPEKYLSGYLSDVPKSFTLLRLHCDITTTSSTMHYLIHKQWQRLRVEASAMFFFDFFLNNSLTSVFTVTSIKQEKWADPSSV